MALDFPISDDEYSKIAAGQRAFLETIAGKIERGEQLASGEILFAAGACRAAAKQIPLKQKRKKGAASRIDGSLAAIQHASGLSYAEITSIHSRNDPEGITEQAVGRAVKRNGRLKAAKSLIDMGRAADTLEQ